MATGSQIFANQQNEQKQQMAKSVQQNEAN
jgi:hypothetical protein